MNYPNHQHSHLPIHRVDDSRQPYYQRQHTVRYYAHRVKESLSTRVSKFICTIFLFILFIVGLIVFILWIGLRPHRPRFRIEDFTITSLAQPTTPPESATLHLNLTIRNSNHKVIVHYYSIDCAVYYKDQQISSTSLQTEPFDQASKTTTIYTKDWSGLTMSGQLWTDLQSDRTGGMVKLNVQINSVIKFEVMSWDTKRHKMHANCDVVLRSDGSILPAKRHQRCPVYFS